jgi:[acyl-carrier-protein] S-malonyltransferase
LGVSQGIEVGPGKVLAGIIKRTCPDLGLLSVGSLAELTALKDLHRDLNLTPTG